MNTYNIKFNDNFFSTLAEFVLDKLHDKATEYVMDSIVILPTKRACRAFIEAIKRKSHTNMLLPKVSAVHESDVNTILGNTLTEKTLMSSVLKTLPEYSTMPLNELSLLASDMLDAVSELEIYEVHHVPDTEHLSDAENISQLLKIKKLFKEATLKAGVRWNVDAKLQNTENLTEYAKSCKCAIAAGISTIVPKEIKLLKTILEKDDGHLVFHGIDTHLGFSQANNAMLSKIGVPESETQELSGTKDSPNPIELIEVKNNYMESQVAALIAKHTLLQNKQESVAIVTDEKKEKQIKYALEGWNLTPRTTNNTKLSDSEFAKFAVLTADFLFSNRSTFLMMQILNNRFCKINPDMFKRLDLFVKFQRFIPDSCTKILNIFLPEESDPVIEVIREAASQDLSARTINECVTLHKEFLEKITDIPLSFSKNWEQFTELSEFLALNNSSEYPQAIKIFMSNMLYKKRTITFNKEVQIISRVDSKLLKFGTVIFPGFNDDTIPGKSLNSIINDFDRCALGLPTKQIHTSFRFLEFIQHAFSSKCFVLRSTSDGSKITMQSRFLTALEKMGLVSKNTFFNNMLDIVRTPKKMPKAQRPAPKPPLELRPTKLSVTEVGNLMRNPYFIYARHVLGLKKLNEFNIGSLHSVKGQLVHKMLDLFIIASQDTAEVDFDKIVEASMNKLLLERSDLGFWMIKLDGMKKWFLETINTVKTTSKHSYSEISGCVEFDVRGRKFSLLCLADRIDWLNDDTVAVIDYKTGSIPSMRDIFAGFSPQLYLEGAIVMNGGFFEELPKKVSKIEIWRLNRANNSEIVPITKNPEKVSASCFKSFKRVIDKFMQDESIPYLAYPRPDITINADPYYHLARVQEWIL